jgi:hypothetical protein
VRAVSDSFLKREMSGRQTDAERYERVNEVGTVGTLMQFEREDERMNV